MPKPGDRVIVDGSKVGTPRREGTLLGEVGRMLRIRWEDGQESLLTPAPGTVRYLPGTSKASGTGRGGGKAAPKARAAKPAARKRPARKS